MGDSPFLLDRPLRYKKRNEFALAPALLKILMITISETGSKKEGAE